MFFFSRFVWGCGDLALFSRFVQGFWDLEICCDLFGDLGGFGDLSFVFAICLGICFFFMSCSVTWGFGLFFSRFVWGFRDAFAICLGICFSFLPRIVWGFVFFHELFGELGIWGFVSCDLFGECGDLGTFFCDDLFGDLMVWVFLRDLFGRLGIWGFVFCSFRDCVWGFLGSRGIWGFVFLNVVCLGFGDLFFHDLFRELGIWGFFFARFVWGFGDLLFFST